MYGVNDPSQKPPRGGPVRGLGTGTSDSIKKSVPAGSYIMPADSTQALGLNRPSVPVNLSDGEHELPPEQVHAVGVQALNQAKNATHAQTPEPRGLSRELFFANGGVVEDPLKKKQTSFDVANTPTGLQPPGSPGRAQQMQMQAQQPVTGPRGLVPNATPAPQAAAGTSFLADRNLDGAQARRAQVQPGQEPRGLDPDAQPKESLPFYAAPLAALQVPGDIAATGVGLAADGLTNFAVRSAGGDPATRPGGENAHTDDAARQMNEHLATVGRGYDEATARVSGAVLGATGAQAVPTVPRGLTPPGQLPPTAAGAPAAPGQPPSTSDAGAQAPGNGYGAVNFDPNQYGVSNNKIVGRTGADGVTEFSNNVADVSGAQGNFVDQQPRGLTPPSANSAGQNASVEPRGLVASGSAANVGNGVGTFSVAGQPGDAAKAIATYDRANAIRAETVKAAHADEPRGLTIIKDSSRGPSLADMQRAKLESRQAQTADTQARGLRADRQLDVETNRNQVNDNLANQKTALDIQSGQLGLESAQRTEELRQQLADPSIQGEQRAQLERSYADRITSPSDKAKLEGEKLIQQQKLVASLYKTYSETAPTQGEGEGQTPVPFEQWAQPALQMLGGQGQQRAGGVPAGMVFAGVAPDGKKVYLDAQGKPHKEA